VNIKSIVEEKRNLVINEIKKQIDKLENDMVPEARFSSRDINFGDVKFGVPSRQTITIENVGKVPIQWSFIPRRGRTNYCYKWLFIVPDKGLIIPAEKLTLTLKVLVNEDTATELNLGNKSLDDILVLHFENGGDNFISISANYIPSSFGCSLEHLIRYPHPISKGPPIPDDMVNLKLKIPKELWRLIDWLYKYSLDEEELFVETGNQDEMAHIMDNLDSGEPLPSKGQISHHSMAESLLRFLESLPDPLIPYVLYRDALEYSSNPTACKNLVASLPDVNQNCFNYVVSFLREVLSHRNRNQLSPEQIAIIFSSVLLRTKADRKVTENIVKKKSNFLLNFVYNK
jgi:phosphatidylinositol-bisphosphatase